MRDHESKLFDALIGAEKILDRIGEDFETEQAMSGGLHDDFIDARQAVRGAVQRGHPERDRDELRAKLDEAVGLLRRIRTWGLECECPTVGCLDCGTRAFLARIDKGGA